MQQNIQKIQRTSRILKSVFLFTLCILPLFDAGFWITNGYPFMKSWGFDWDLAKIVPGDTPLDQMSNLLRLFGFAITLIPTSLSMISLYWVAKLFGLFEQLQFFTQKSVRYLRKIGLILLINSLIHSTIYMGLLSLVLTMSNPPEHRQIIIAFGTHEITLIVISSILLLLSWIMEEGHKLQEEHEATV